MKRMHCIFIVLVFGFSLAGCDQATPVAKPPVDVPASQDLFPFAGESQHLYEQNLHLFEYDQNAPLEIQTEEEWRENDNTWSDITYASAGGRRASAKLTVPDGRGPFAGLVVLHTMPAEFLNMYAAWGAVVLLVTPVWPSLENDGYPTLPKKNKSPGSRRCGR